jgi:hypothetical protein
MPKQPNKLLAALYGGILTGVFSVVPYLNLLNCLCCAGILLGGFLSVFFYTRDAGPESRPLSSSDALQLGTLAGVFGAIITVVVSAITLVGFNGLAEVTTALEQMRGQVPAETFTQIEGLLRSGPMLFLLLSVTWTVISTIFGLLGGLIGYAVLRQKPPPLSPPNAPPAA